MLGPLGDCDAAAVWVDVFAALLLRFDVMEEGFGVDLAGKGSGPFLLGWIDVADLPLTGFWVSADVCHSGVLPRRGSWVVDVIDCKAFNASGP